MQPWTIFGQLFSMVGGNASFGSCDINHTSNASIRAVFNTDGFLTVFFLLDIELDRQGHGTVKEGNENLISTSRLSVAVAGIWELQ